jgi:chemotaxis protein methyltransferase CheR
MIADDMAFLAGVVRSRSGQLLTPDKGYLVQSRLGPVARRENYASVAELLQALRLRRDETLAWAVTEALANTETMFFRDRAPFAQFRDEVLPLLAAARPGGMVRVWSAGCSTGQEPYSLAMLMAEAAERFPGVTLDILATDLSARCLEVAQAGLYSQFEVQRGLPIRLLVKYFVKHEDHWRLIPAVRRAVRFQAANLLDDTLSLGRFDAIFCRNVLSGLHAEARGVVLERLGRQLAPTARCSSGPARRPRARRCTRCPGGRAIISRLEPAAPPPDRRQQGVEHQRDQERAGRNRLRREQAHAEEQ